FILSFRPRRPPRSTLFPTRRSSDLHGNRSAVVIEIYRVDIPSGVNNRIEDQLYFVAHLYIGIRDFRGPGDLFQDLRSGRERETAKKNERNQKSFVHICKRWLHYNPLRRAIVLRRQALIRRSQFGREAGRQWFHASGSVWLRR